MDEAASGSANGQTIYDDSGNGYNGTGNDGANNTGLTRVTGRFGSAISFDGVDDYVPTGSINFGSGDFSGSCWVKSSDVSGAQRRMFGKDFNTPGPGGWFWFNFGSGNPYLEFKDSSNVVSSLASGGSIADGAWHHVAFTVDRTGNSDKIYIDGILKNSNTPNFTGIFGDATSTKTVNIGGQPGLYLNAVIDDVRIYNYARTAEQITQDYNAGAAARMGD
jgi:hypothetical protein